MKLCACGCGGTVKEFYVYGDRKSIPTKSKFIRGHNPTSPKISRGSEHYNWQGGKKLHDGYILIWKPDHPFCNSQGYVREHRLIMEKALGRYLDSNEVIHHKNGKSNDNRLENLELVNNQGLHMSEHLKINWIKGIYTHNQYSNYKPR